MRNRMERKNQSPAQRQANIARDRQRREAREQIKLGIIESNRKARANRSPYQQLAELDFRLGENQGAKKERARLKSLGRKAA